MFYNLSDNERMAWILLDYLHLKIPEQYHFVSAYGTNRIRNLLSECSTALSFEMKDKEKKYEYYEKLDQIRSAFKEWDGNHYMIYCISKVMHLLGVE